MNKYEKQREKIANGICSLYLERYRKQLTTRFAFEGDPLFTKRKQRLFFNTAFKFNHVGITLGNKKQGLIILKMVPIEWDLDGRVRQAEGIKAIPRATISKDKDLDESFIKKLKPNEFVTFAFEDGEIVKPSPRDIFLYRIKPLLMSLIYEFLTLSENEASKLLIQKGDNQIDKKTSKNLKDPKTKVVELDSVENDEEDNIPNEVDNQIKELLGIVKLNGNVKDFYEIIRQSIQWVDKMLGQRHDTTYLKGQSIQAETRDASADIFFYERYMLTSFETFVEDYNETFGTNLVLIDYLKGYLDQEKSNEFKSGEQVDTSTNGGIDLGNKGAQND